VHYKDTMFEVGIKEIEKPIDTSFEGSGSVILFNDDWHTFDDVIIQLMLATNCNARTAEQHAFEVHNTGQSKVFKGPLEDCLVISAVLEEIALKTEVIH